MIPIAILASGRGSNFDAIEKAIREKKLDAEIVAVISDRPGAAVLKKAEEKGLRAICVPPSSPSRSQSPSQLNDRTQAEERRRLHDSEILKALDPFKPRFLVMAGYMRLVSPVLLDAFRSSEGTTRITNIHPSLLPAFPGVGGYAQAFRYGAGFSGVTVHLVDEQMDSGPILAQEAFSISDCQTEAEVESRGLAIEHRLYPETLSWVLPGKFTLEKREGRICVRAS